MFSLICAWINAWVNNREAGDLRRHRAHYDVVVMRCRLINENMLKFCNNDIDGIVPDSSNSSALAVEILLSCTKPSMQRLGNSMFNFKYSWGLVRPEIHIDTSLSAIIICSPNGVGSIKLERDLGQKITQQYIERIAKMPIVFVFQFEGVCYWNLICWQLRAIKKRMWYVTFALS